MAFRKTAAKSAIPERPIYFIRADQLLPQPARNCGASATYPGQSYAHFDRNLTGTAVDSFVLQDKDSLHANLGTGLLQEWRPPARDWWRGWLPALRSALRCGAHT